MKKSANILLLIILITAIIINLNIELGEKDKDYKGELADLGPQSQDISISVSPAVPVITITSPENITYSTTEILLDYEIKNEQDSVWYNLDNTENITITSPTTISIPTGTHILYLYANNTEGVSVKNISFSVQTSSTTPPTTSPGSSSGTSPSEPTQPTDNKTEELGDEEGAKPLAPQKETPKLAKYSKQTIILTIIFIIIAIAVILLTNKKSRKFIKTRLKKFIKKLK